MILIASYVRLFSSTYKRPLGTALAAYTQFYSKIYRLLIANNVVNLVWHDQILLSQHALIRDDKHPFIIDRHPWTKGYGYARLD